MSETAQQQLAEVSMDQLVTQASRLYSLPDVYLKVKHIIDDPNSEVRQLGDALMTDPSLSTRLLTIANSAFYGLCSKVDTITRAVQVIGFRQIHSLVVATSITHAFKGLSSETVNIEKFWMASVERALLARTLAESKCFPEAERMFVGGLLLDIGHLVMYEHVPEMVQQTMDIAEAQLKPLHVVEREILGFSAAELGASLARHWQLPDSLANQILYQDTPDLADNKIEVAITHVAKQLAGTVPESDAIAEVFHTLSAGVKETLGLSQQDCEDTLLTAMDRLSDTLELIIP